MKKFNTLDIAALIIWLLPAAYLLYVYPNFAGYRARPFRVKRRT